MSDICRICGISAESFSALEAEAQALRDEVADARRDAERHELRANQYSEELAALRARVVVPERKISPNDENRYTDHDYDWHDGFNECLDELARLNGKAVSEGLLRSSREAISEYAEGIRSLVRRVPGTDQRLAELDQCIADLSELLGEGKEVGDGGR